MATSTLYQESAELVHPHDNDLKGKARVSIIDETIVVTIQAALGAMNASIHIDDDSLRAFAKLLNDAVDALPAKVEEAA